MTSTAASTSVRPRHVPLAQFKAARDADEAYKVAKRNLEAELRIELEKRLGVLQGIRAAELRKLHEAIVAETGRPNYAALGRALATRDHNTVKQLLATTEGQKETIQGLTSHPDDGKISKDTQGYYTFRTNAGDSLRFRLDRGEPVGLSPAEMDAFDDEKMLDRIIEWESRNG